jgi:putative glutamine amidotransferase
MDRPLIAVTSDVRELDGTLWHAAQQQYVAAAANGALVTPMLVPALGSELDIDAVLDAVHGVMATGSKSNVFPGLYGGDASEANGPYDPARDATSMPLIARAIARGIPVLAICRGMQELNVVLGGTLQTEIQERAAALDHRMPEAPTRAERYANRQTVSVTPDSCLAAITGATALQVNSLHRQGIDVLAADLRVEGTAEDGIIEAVSGGNDGFVLGVQWHPEYWVMTDPTSAAIFWAFGDAVRQHAASVAGKYSIVDRR